MSLLTAITVVVFDPMTKKAYQVEVQTNYERHNGPTASKLFGKFITSWQGHTKHERIQDPDLFYCFVHINANRTEPSLSLGWLVSISTSYSRNDNTRAQGRTSHASQTAYASHGTTGCAGPRRPMSRLPESPAAWHDLCTSRRAEDGWEVGDGSRGDGDRVRTGRATPMRGTKPRGARR